MKKTITFFLIPLLALLASGCFTASPESSKIPQGRPASWEYSLPGGFEQGGFNR